MPPPAAAMARNGRLTLAAVALVVLFVLTALGRLHHGLDHNAAPGSGLAGVVTTQEVTKEQLPADLDLTRVPGQAPSLSPVDEPRPTTSRPTTQPPPSPTRPATPSPTGAAPVTPPAPTLSPGTSTSPQATQAATAAPPAASAGGSWADRVAALDGTPATRLRQARLDLLKVASECWALHGKWTFEPASFFNSTRGELSKQTCPMRPSAERQVEIGHRWIPTPSAACPPAYYRNAELVTRLLTHLHCHPLLTVGDSLSEQYTRTLEDYVSSYAPARRLQHTFVYNAHLRLNENFQWAYPAKNKSMLTPWAPLLKTHSYSAILLNRGAHFVPTDSVLPQLRETLAYMREHNPSALYLYRTAPPGHDNCEAMMNHPPLEKPPTKISGFSWALMPPQNAAVATMIEQAFPDVVVVNVDNATALRPDSHRVAIQRRNPAGPTVPAAFDCTHYCIPGPIDMWFEVVANLLLLAVDLGHLQSCAQHVQQFSV